MAKGKGKPRSILIRDDELLGIIERTANEVEERLGFRPNTTQVLRYLIKQKEKQQ